MIQLLRQFLLSDNQIHCQWFNNSYASDIFFHLDRPENEISQ